MSYERFQHHLRETLGCASVTFYVSDRLSRLRTRLLRGRQRRFNWINCLDWINSLDRIDDHAYERWNRLLGSSKLGVPSWRGRCLHPRTRREYRERRWEHDVTDVYAGG